AVPFVRLGEGQLKADGSFFFQAEDGIRDGHVTGVQTCALPILAASAASILGRSKEFKSLLFREERTRKQQVYLVLWFGIPIALGVWIRFSARSFFAGDLSLETTILLGIIVGRLGGVLGGMLIALPAVLHGEWATLPFNVLCGFIAGQLREIAPDKEDIWSF